jgi:hypothetical protein
MSKDSEAIIPTLDTSHQEETNKGEVYALEDINKANDEQDDDIMAQKRKALDEGQPVQLKSEFDTLGTLKAISVFRKTAFICAIAGFAASTDGNFFPEYHGSRLISQGIRIRSLPTSLLIVDSSTNSVVCMVEFGS